VNPRPSDIRGFTIYLVRFIRRQFRDRSEFQNPAQSLSALG
jgi:hypothetical protein